MLLTYNNIAKVSKWCVNDKDCILFYPHVKNNLFMETANKLQLFYCSFGNNLSITHCTHKYTSYISKEAYANIKRLHTSKSFVFYLYLMLLANIP